MVGVPLLQRCTSGLSPVGRWWCLWAGGPGHLKRGRRECEWVQTPNTEDVGESTKLSSFFFLLLRSIFSVLWQVKTRINVHYCQCWTKRNSKDLRGAGLFTQYYHIHVSCFSYYGYLQYWHTATPRLESQKLSEGVDKSNSDMFFFPPSAVDTLQSL